MSEIENTMQMLPGLHLQAAEYLNSKHKQIAIGTRQLIDTALEIGQFLCELQKFDGFTQWVEDNRLVH